MFEGIAFADFEGTLSFSRPSKAQATWGDYDFTAAESAEYQIAGRTKYVLSAPISDEMARSLIYLQSFDLMDSDRSYRTYRKGCRSILLIYTYEGAGRLRYRGSDYELGPQDAFLIDCSCKHEYHTEGDRWLHADLNFFGGAALHYVRDVLGGFAPVFRCTRPDLLQRRLESVLLAHQSSRQDRAYRTSAELQALLFDAQSWMNETAGDSGETGPVQTLRAYLDRSFGEPISLDEMARIAGLSKYHLCRRFKREVGLSPKEYVVNLRVQQAKQLLDATEIPCYRIGQLVGFGSEAGFIGHFKQVTGMTPHAYRKRPL